MLILGDRVEPRWRRQYRLLRWILIPYFGLLAGGLSPRLMGLADIDWVAGLGLGLAIVFTILVLLTLIRISVHWEGPYVEDLDTQLPLFGPIVTPLIAAGALEFHWTFLRGAIWEMLVSMPSPPSIPSYWAVWLAAILATPGIVTLHRSGSRRLIDIVILITTSILFFYTRNYWLCWLLHFSAQLLLLRPHHTRSPA